MLLPVRQEVCDPPAGGVRHTHLGELVLKQSRNDCVEGRKLILLNYRPPGPYIPFVSRVSDFLSTLAVKTDKVLNIGRFHDGLRTAFQYLIDSIIFPPNLNPLKHCSNHTNDLVLTSCIQMEHVTVLPQTQTVTNPTQTVHHLIKQFCHKPYPNSSSLD